MRRVICCDALLPPLDDPLVGVCTHNQKKLNKIKRISIRRKLETDLKTVNSKESFDAYGVATISRLLKIIGLFCKRDL